jgi:16S rRNA (cytosine967-C5)-methyltransferase
MKPKAANTSRALALNVLQDVFGSGAYANIALSKQLNESRLSPIDRRFATELAYGSIKAQGTLDWMIGHYLKRPLAQTDLLVVNILRLGMYQLHYLDKIPPSAAVNESVNLAKTLAHPGSSGFINAVLRSAIREPDRIRYPNIAKDPVRHIALRECHPEWMVRRWLEEIGMEETQALCRFNNSQPPLCLRAHTLKVSRAELVEKMIAAGVDLELSTLVPEGILCHRSSDEPLQFIRQGVCQAQDESSMLVAHVVSPQPGEFVIDACAAPGGKSTHLATLMQDRGRVLSVDIHAHKMRLIEDNKRRLGLNIIEPLQMDATKLHTVYGDQADRVLVDAPCSGLGVLRRRPDSRWRKEESLASLPDLQKNILSSAAQCVKPGGVLVYSTCTLEARENEQVVEWFLEKNPQFALDGTGNYFPVPRPERMITLWPQRDGTDGFFIARMSRKLEGMES